MSSKENSSEQIGSVSGKTNAYQTKRPSLYTNRQISDENTVQFLRLQIKTSNGSTQSTITNLFGNIKIKMCTQCHIKALTTPLPGSLLHPLTFHGGFLTYAVHATAIPSTRLQVRISKQMPADVCNFEGCTQTKWSIIVLLTPSKFAWSHCKKTAHPSKPVFHNYAIRWNLPIPTRLRSLTYPEAAFSWDLQYVKTLMPFGSLCLLKQPITSRTHLIEFLHLVCFHFLALVAKPSHENVGYDTLCQCQKQIQKNVL